MTEIDKIAQIWLFCLVAMLLQFDIILTTRGERVPQTEGTLLFIPKPAIILNFSLKSLTFLAQAFILLAVFA